MRHLVRASIAYARSVHGVSEPVVRVDLNALLDSLVYDYLLTGRVDDTVTLRPVALHRVVANLIDNALKYAGVAEVDIGNDGDGDVLIRVSDRGPGIPEAEPGKVLEPFYRLEGSRNSDTGGTGLGLAIAQQLARSLGATLTPRNRATARAAGGGLEAIVHLHAGGVAG